MTRVDTIYTLAAAYLGIPRWHHPPMVCSGHVIWSAGDQGNRTTLDFPHTWKDESMLAGTIDEQARHVVEEYFESGMVLEFECLRAANLQRVHSARATVLRGRIAEIRESIAAPLAEMERLQEEAAYESRASEDAAEAIAVARPLMVDQDLGDE